MVRIARSYGITSVSRTSNCVIMAARYRSSRKRSSAIQTRFQAIFFPDCRLSSCSVPNRRYRILKKLAEKGYDGALSVELFLPELQGGDPQEVATRIRTKCEKVMREADVL